MPPATTISALPVAGTAHHIQRHGRDSGVETTAQSRLARGVLAQASRKHTSHQALVDTRWIDRRTRDSLAHNQCAKLGCGEAGERALKPSHRRSHRRDDHRFIVHSALPCAP